MKANFYLNIGRGYFIFLQIVEIAQFLANFKHENAHKKEDQDSLSKSNHHTPKAC